VKANGNGVEAGETQTVVKRFPFVRQGTIVFAHVYVLTSLFGRSFSDTYTYKTCLHEVGHALGLQGHSRTASDIMFATLNPYQVPYLTERDGNTIDALYAGAQTNVAQLGEQSGAPVSGMMPGMVPGMMAPSGNISGSGFGPGFGPGLGSGFAAGAPIYGAGYSGPGYGGPGYGRRGYIIPPDAAQGYNQPVWPGYGLGAPGSSAFGFGSAAPNFGNGNAPAGYGFAPGYPWR
jgi:hypothetical protein